MKRPRPRVRRRCLIALGLLVLPPLAWSLVLAVIPTGWARSRVVARLEAVSGRSVHVGRLRVGALGGLILGDVSVASPASPNDPWLRLGDGRIDVSLLQLVCGQVDPTDLRIDGLTLRVLRRADGTFELADSDPAPAQTAAAVAKGSAEPSALRFSFADARVTVIDASSGSRLELTGAEGRGSWEGRHATITEAHGTLNGGQFDLAATLDRSGPAPTVEGEFRAAKVALDRGMEFLDYLAPVRGGSAAGLEGRLDLNVHLRGQVTGRADLRRTLVGRGTISLDPVQLDGSPLVAELADALDVPLKGRVGSVHSDFTIRNGRVATENLSIDVARLPVVLAGWTDFDGRLDYRLACDRLAGRLSDQARDLLADLRIDELPSLRVVGTLDRLSVTLDGQPFRQAVDGTGEKPKLRDFTHRLKERILR